MRKRPRHLSPGRQQPDISLNSFLDLVLNILLFFVFATELAVTKSLNVAVPKTEYGETTSKDNESLLIQVTKDSRYFIGKDEVAAAKLPSQMRERKAANPNLKSVIVRGDLGRSDDLRFWDSQRGANQIQRCFLENSDGLRRSS
jgi:biopolymer transport protein ExbD